MPLVATAHGRVARFRVSGWDVSPPEWIGSPPSRRQRRRYYRILESEVFNQKMASLAAGEDRWGAPLAPVKLPRSGTSDWHGRPYRRGGGPPLMPFGVDSRARNLLRSRSDSRSVVISWIPAPLKNPRRGGPRTFTEIINLHASGMAGTGRKGQVTGIIRDIVGLPDSRLLVAIERAIRRYRLGEKPRPLEYPNTSRSGASRREARRPEPQRKVSNRLGRGATTGRGPVLVQRLIGAFGF